MGTCCLTDMLESQNSKRIHVILQQTHEWIFLSSFQINFWITWLERKVGRLDPVFIFSLITKFKKETCNLATNPWMNIPILFSNKLLNYLIREKSRSVGPSRSFVDPVLGPSRSFVDPSPLLWTHFLFSL